VYSTDLELQRIYSQEVLLSFFRCYVVSHSKIILYDEYWDDDSDGGVDV